MNMTMNQGYAPAVFADHASPKVSGSYSFIPTFKIVEELEREGYSLNRAEQKKSRIVDNRIYAKHVLRFRREGQQAVNGLFPEILVINSHNTSSALRFAGGFFRMVCSNGLVTGDMLADMRVYHTSNNTAQKVLEAAHRCFAYVDGKLEIVRDMADKMLDFASREEFAYEAAEIFPNTFMSEPAQLLYANRVEDTPNTLWHTYNRVQENLKRGNFQLVGQTGKVRKSRGVRSIDLDLQYNQKLWALAESYL
jgi:hypothetical protein